MAKFVDVAGAVKYLGSLVVVPKHGVVLLQAIRKGGLLEVGDGYHVRLTDCEPVEYDFDDKIPVIHKVSSGNTDSILSGFIKGSGPESISSADSKPGDLRVFVEGTDSVAVPVEDVPVGDAGKFVDVSDPVVVPGDVWASEEVKERIISEASEGQETDGSSDFSNL